MKMMILFELTVTNCMEIKETYTSSPALNYAILKRREMYHDVTISFLYTITLSYIVKKVLENVNRFTLTTFNRLLLLLLY